MTCCDVHFDDLHAKIAPDEELLCSFVHSDGGVVLGQQSEVLGGNVLFAEDVEHIGGPLPLLGVDGSFQRRRYLSSFDVVRYGHVGLVYAHQMIAPALFQRCHIWYTMNFKFMLIFPCFFYLKN